MKDALQATATTLFPFTTFFRSGAALLVSCFVACISVEAVVSAVAGASAGSVAAAAVATTATALEN